MFGTILAKKRLLPFLDVISNPTSLFLPAALAEAGLEIAFKVGPSRTTLSGGGGRDICLYLPRQIALVSLPPRPNLAGEVEILVKWRWVGTTELISTAKTAGLHATTAKSAFLLKW